MDRRTKIIAGAFGACLIYVLFSSAIYPIYVEPLLTLDERIAVREKERAELQEKEARAVEARLEYREFLNRIGAFDDLKVQNALRERLNVLIDRYKLEGANTSPSRSQEDRKTHVKTMQVTVTAAGSFEAAIGFLKEVSELPGLLRISNAAIYPAGTSRKQKRRDRVNLRVPIEVRVLPQNRMLGERLKPEDLQKPDVLVRHEERDYSAIWRGEHFTPVIPLKPLVAEAGMRIQVKQNARKSMNGGAKGGDGNYTWLWSPLDYLSDATSPKPRIDTAEPGTITYTLTVKDGSGNSATDDVTVIIKEKKPRVTRGPPPPIDPEPPPPPDNRWKERKFLQLRMTLMRTEGDSRLEEVMVYNTKSRETAYYETGTDFDGGMLVCVHPRGGVVRRDGAYYVYPIGERLDKEFKADEAADYPVLQRLAMRHREAEPVKQPESEGDGGSDGPGVNPAPPDSEKDKASAEDGKPSSGPSKPDNRVNAGKDDATSGKAGAARPEAAPDAVAKTKKPVSKARKSGGRKQQTKRREARPKETTKP